VVILKVLEEKEADYGTKCPHHPYMVRADIDMEGRIRELEKISSSTNTIIMTLCEKISTLTESLNDLITSYNGIKGIEVSNTVRIKNTEDNIKEVRGWIIGGMSTALLMSIGWIIWWLQNHYSAIVKAMSG